MTKWPKKKDIEKILKEINSNPALYSQTIPDDASRINLIKRDLCAALIGYIREHNMNQRELAQRLEISEALVSKIIRYHFGEFTVDRLVRYLEKLGIKFEFRRVA